MAGPPPEREAPMCRWGLFFFQAEDGIRDKLLTGVQTCALPIYSCRVTRAAIGSRRETSLPCKRRLFVHAPMAAAATAEPDTRRNSRLFMVMDSTSSAC